MTSNSTSSSIAGRISNVWAVGRNYADHAKELNNVVPANDEEPIVFLKAGSCVVENGATFSLPDFSRDIHHECEIAFQFDRDLQLSHMTLALDLTAREVQSTLKSKQHPWTLAKSFKSSCPVGPLIPVPKNLDFTAIEFTLRVNGELRQSGVSSDMIHSIPKLREYVIARFPVEAGDLLLTGTPKGVALIKSGDQLTAEIPGLLKATWAVAR